MHTAVTAESWNQNWRRQWQLLQRAAVLGLFAHVATGCLLIDSGEGKDQPAVPSTYFVQVFDYQVTDVASGVNYASGCNVSTGGASLGSLGIVAKILLDVDYLVEVTALRHQSGSLSDHDNSYYCQLPYETITVEHVNPSCYQIDPFWNEHELIEASLVDADGNTMSSTTSFMIAGTTTDVAKFKLRSHAYGNVRVNYAGPPCNGGSSYPEILISIEQP